MRKWRSLLAHVDSNFMVDEAVPDVAIAVLLRCVCS